jgi:hypothetical protein
MIKPLKEQIPESDQRGKEPLVKGEVFEGGQPEEGAAGEELDKKAEEASRGEVRRSGDFWILGVFLDFPLYAYCSRCIHICYSLPREAKNH